MTNEADGFSSRSKLLFDRILAVRPGVPDREMENKTSRRCWGKLPAASNAARSTSKFFRRIWWSAFPAQMLSNRPDVKNAEYSLAQAFYNTAGSPVGVLSGPQSERYAGLDQRWRCYDARSRQMDLQRCGIARTAHLQRGAETRHSFESPKRNSRRPYCRSSRPCSTREPK